MGPVLRDDFAGKPGSCRAIPCGAVRDRRARRCESSGPRFPLHGDRGGGQPRATRTSGMEPSQDQQQEQHQHQEIHFRLSQIFVPDVQAWPTEHHLLDEIGVVPRGREPDEHNDGERQDGANAGVSSMPRKPENTPNGGMPGRQAEQRQEESAETRHGIGEPPRAPDIPMYRARMAYHAIRSPLVVSPRRSDRPGPGPAVPVSRHIPPQHAEECR